MWFVVSLCRTVSRPTSSTRWTRLTWCSPRSTSGPRASPSPQVRDSRGHVTHDAVFQLMTMRNWYRIIIFNIAQRFLIFLPAILPATVFQKLLFLSYVKLYLLFPFSVLLEFFCCSLPTINTISMFYSFSARLLLDACLRCGRDEPSLQAEWHKSLSFIAKKVFLFLHSLRQPFTSILIMLLQGPKLWIWSVSNSSMITWNM